MDTFSKGLCNVFSVETKLLRNHIHKTILRKRFRTYRLQLPSGMGNTLIATEVFTELSIKHKCAFVSKTRSKYSKRIYSVNDFHSIYLDRSSFKVVVIDGYSLLNDESKAKLEEVITAQEDLLGVFYFG